MHPKSMKHAQIVLEYFMQTPMPSFSNHNKHVQNNKSA